jgi:integrase/recombinase XerD
MDDYRSYLKVERSFSENTVDAYMRDTRKLLQYLEEKKIKAKPEEVAREQLEDFVNWIADSNLVANSQTRIISGVRAFYKYLLVEDVIDHDPTAFLKRPRLERKIPEVLSVEEVEKMLESFDLTSTYGIRNRAMLETMYATGLRVSELISLRLTDLFLDTGFVRIIGKNNKERMVPIGEDAVHAIERYIEQVRNLQQNIQPESANILFLNHRGSKMTRVMAFKIVKDATAQAGVEKNVSPHTIRHSFATHLTEGGANLRAVQDMLGHETVTTTEIYAHMDKEYLKETVMLYHPRHQQQNKKKKSKKKTA